MHSGTPTPHPPALAEQRVTTWLTPLPAAVFGSLVRLFQAVWITDRRRGSDSRETDSASFESLQQLLRIADTWPSGTVGTEVRRAACDLIESNSSWARAASLRRLRTCAARERRRTALGRGGSDDLSEALIDALARYSCPPVSTFTRHILIATSPAAASAGFDPPVLAIAPGGHDGKKGE